MNIALFSAYRLLNPTQLFRSQFYACANHAKFACIWNKHPSSLLHASWKPNKTAKALVDMVISGRMADVCAELDRLAEFENRH